MIGVTRPRLIDAGAAVDPATVHRCRSRALRVEAVAGIAQFRKDWETAQAEGRGAAG
jgi:hypothetical protein